MNLDTLLTKYPHSTGDIGYYKRTSGGSLVDCTNSDVDKPTTTNIVINPTGIQGSLHTIKLIAIKTIKLHQEYINLTDSLQPAVNQLLLANNIVSVTINLERELTQNFRSLNSTLTQSIAYLALLKVHNEVLFNKLQVSTNFLHNKTQFLPQFNATVPFEDILTFGYEARGNYSIFDRATYHYTKYLKGTQ